VRRGVLAAVLVLAMLSTAPQVAAQVGPPADSSAAAAAAVAGAPRVWVVTLGQGDAIWERFGHNFLAVEDPVTGQATAYNWGVFDFAAPDFVSRFVWGEPRYWIEGVAMSALVEHYRQRNRSVVLQELEFTSSQAHALLAFLRWNARDENRFYRYDYFRDNCSTRLRDAIDRALGGALRAQTRNRVTNLTYRSESVRLTSDAPAAQVGIAFALGQPADQLLSAWEASFVPMRLMEYLREVQVAGPDGDPRPLVRSEQQVARATREPEETRAASMLGELAALGLLLAGAVAGLARFAMRGSGAARTAFATTAALWGAGGGLLGVTLLFAWAATRHEYWYRNENLLHFNPLALALAVLVPLAVRRTRWRRAAAQVGVAVAALSVIGVVLKLGPWLPQENWGFVLLALPVHLALAWSLRRLDRAPRGDRPRRG